MFKKVFLMLLQGPKKQSGAELELQDQKPPERAPGYCKYVVLLCISAAPNILPSKALM